MIAVAINMTWLPLRPVRQPASEPSISDRVS